MACANVASPSNDAILLEDDAPSDTTLVAENELKTSELLSTTSINWAQHRYAQLLNPVVTLRVCSHHFPAGSAARREVEEAVAMFNAVPGTRARLVIEETEHVSASEMFGPREGTDSFAYFDYVSEAFPCHGEESYDDCRDWSMNTCPHSELGGWNLIGNSTAFNVSVNAFCRDHDSDPAATDYPRSANIAHELGHGFGMEHSESWPSADRGFISIMQGNHDMLSAYDVAFLRANYPENVSETPSVVPSRVTRFIDEDGTITRYWYRSSENPGGKGRYNNPTAWFIDSDGEVKDCATSERPVYHVAWFNVGTGSTEMLAESDADSLHHSLSLSTTDGEASLELASIYAVQMPASSQDQASVTVEASWTALTGFALDQAHKIVFTTNSQDRAAMASATIEASVWLASSEESCR